MAAGNVTALNNLGYLLYYGMGGPKEQQRAVALWWKGARLGVSEAQWHLGTVYESGKGLPQSDTQAYAWYRCALASTERAPPGERDLEAQIARDIHTSLDPLLRQISAAERKAGERLAVGYIRDYAHRPTT